MKYTLTNLLVLFLLFTAWGNIQANSVTPDDITTTETLIQLHKKLAKQEKEARKNYALMTAGQEFVTNATDKFEKARSTLDSKLNDLNQYLQLSAAIVTTGISLYKLIDEYADFTSNTYTYAKKKPMVLWYYNNANKAIAQEVKHCEKLYAVMAASGVTLMRSSIKEKINLIYTMKNSIERARSILWRANIYCSLMVAGGYTQLFIQDVLDDAARTKIAIKVSEHWNR